MNENLISIELAYATPERQWLETLLLARGSTVADALDKSDVFNVFPHLDKSTLTLGIFSKRVELTTLLQAGDRLEIYRPLQVDPKVARKRRAEKKRAQTDKRWTRRTRN